MANHLLTALRKIRLPGTVKAVAMVLADRADHKHQCYPSNKTLADETGFSVRTVQRAIACLVKLGLLVVARRHRPDGSFTSNLFTLLIGKKEKTAPTGEKPQAAPSKRLTLAYDSPDWWAASEHILNRVKALYPLARPEIVSQMIDCHLEYWEEASRRNPKLVLTLNELTGKFFVREKEMLAFAGA